MKIKIVDKLERTVNFIQSYLRDSFPNIDTSPLSAIYDLVIKPVAKMLTYMEEQVDNIKSLMFFDTIENIEDENLKKKAYDYKASNYFTVRRKGKKATAELILTFAEYKTYVIPGDTIFFTNSLNFYIVGKVTTVIGLNDLRAVTDGSGATLYAYRLTVEAATEGSGYNLDAGLTWNTSWKEVSLKNIINANIVDDGVDEESNLELKERCEHSMVVRNLVNKRSMIYQLQTNFPSIKAFEVVGNLDRELFREMIDFNGITLAIGNKCDLYVYTKLIKEREINLFDMAEHIEVTDGPDIVRLYFPEEIFYKITDIMVDDTSIAGEFGITRENLLTDNEDTRFSFNEKPYFDIDATDYFTFIDEDPIPDYGVLTGSYKYVLDIIPSMKDIDAFLQSTNEMDRVVLADYLVRGFAPCYLSFNLEVQIKSTELVSGSEIVSFIEDYLHGHFEPYFNIGDLIDLLKDNFPIVKVDVPVWINYKLYSPNGKLYHNDELPEEGSGIDPSTLDLSLDEVQDEIIALDADFNLEEGVFSEPTWVSLRLVKMVPGNINVKVV